MNLNIVDYANIVSALFGFLSFIVALIGFYKVNSSIKNININHINNSRINFDNSKKHSQKQEVGNNSKGYQAGGNIGNINEK